jgi:hypothetical protein
VLCFPHEGRIVTVDQLSVAHVDPTTSPVSVVPLIENLQWAPVNWGVGMYPSLMGTFDFLAPSLDVNSILTVPEQSMLKLISFKLDHFKLLTLKICGLCLPRRLRGIDWNVSEWKCHFLQWR